MLANTILSHYRIVSKLRAGGMGEVYLAQDTKLEESGDQIPERRVQDAAKLGRFIQEAKAASALNHPNVLTVHEIGETNDTNYIVNLSRLKVDPMMDPLRDDPRFKEMLKRLNLPE